MKILDRFKKDVQDFLTRNDVAKTAFGATVVNDPHAVFRWFSKNGDLKVSTLDKVYDYMENHET